MIMKGNRFRRYYNSRRKLYVHSWQMPIENTDFQNNQAEQYEVISNSVYLSKGNKGDSAQPAYVTEISTTFSNTKAQASCPPQPLSSRQT